MSAVIEHVAARPQPVSFSASRAEVLERRLADRSRPLHVVGLGTFGGNSALVRWLAGRGHRVVLWEAKRREELADAWEELGAARERVEARWAEARPALPTDDLVLLSPAVPPTHPSLAGRNADGIGTEIELSMLRLWRYGSRAHVVTGSVGKSTTASLLAAALGVPLFGNIGASLLERDEPPPPEVVLELSSFQLHYLRPCGFTPSGCIMTPLRDNHADWHGSLEAYHQAKLWWINRWRERVPGVRADEQPAAAPALRVADGRLHGPGLPREGVDLDRRFPLLGEHNRDNLLLALRLAAAWTPLTEEVLARVFAFPGLPHRLEVVGRRRGCRFVNDSKATSPPAVLRALDCVRPGGLLILQGQDKGKDFGAVLSRAAALGAQVHALGELGAALGKLPGVTRHGDLDDLFRAVDVAGLSGLDVLFSPGSPSYDRYRNYEERGGHFRRLVLALGD